jgi:hypothetical protein
MNQLASQMARIDDRRAASHFREADRPLTRNSDPQTLAPEIDWARYAVDRQYRGIVNGLHHHPPQERGRELER